MNSKNSTKPNIVFILSDDHGAWAMGCAGNDELITPNLDRLAKEGILFNNFFCVSPVCSPARASILTGRIPSQHGIHDWILSGNIDYDKLSEEMKKRPGLKYEDKPIEYLEGQMAYTEVLAQNGYRCGLSGKWHLGNSVVPQKGFEYWSIIAKGGCNYYESEIIQNGEVVSGDKYLTDIITENAIDFLEQNEIDNRPFYLSVHYTAPHSPWNKENHPEDIWKMYDDCNFESVPDVPMHPWLIDQFKDLKGDKRKEALQGYYTAITAMDKGIGKVLDKINEMGIRDNTLIIFTSDNGMSMGHHGIFGKGNGTFPLNMYDTSVKVPTIISLPNKKIKDKISDKMLSHYDIMPTLLDYLGYKNPEENKLPGKSFVPILKGEEFKGQENVVIFDEYGPVRMIRSKEWKYVHRYPYGPHELYNLVNDPDENENLINDASYEKVLVELKGRLQEWFIKYTDPKFDGCKEAVSGNGQINLAGPEGKGEKAFI